MAFQTVSLEHWRAHMLGRVNESRAFSGDSSHNAPATIDELVFTIFAGRVFWNRLHINSLTDFFPRNNRIELPTGAELRGPDSKRKWGQLYFLAGEMLFAVVEADMQLTPAQFGLSTNRLEIAENAKAVSELLTPRFARYFLALQPLDTKIEVPRIIDWIERETDKQLHGATNANVLGTNALELMAA